jgi:uncharacterized protein with PIN domain
VIKKDEVMSKGQHTMLACHKCPFVILTRDYELLKKVLKTIIVDIEKHHKKTEDKLTLLRNLFPKNLKNNLMEMIMWL